MKNILKRIFAVALCLITALPINTLAADEEPVLWHDVVLTDSQFQSILDLNPQDPNQTRANDLIVSYNVAINKDGSDLYVAAKLICSTTVEKCGFKKIAIQRRIGSGYSWSDYCTYEKLYVEGSSYTTARMITPPAGYQYRAVCTFYAKKNILSTQTIELSSNMVTF